MNYDYCNGITYTIKKGDSLYEISRRHNIALGLLLRANPYVDVFNLQVGDTICIPKKEQQAMPFSNAGNGAAGMEMMPDGQSGNGTAGMEMMPGGQSGNGAAGMEMMPDDQSGNGAAGMEMMPDDQSGSRGSTDRTSASAGREQMDEMLVWSEQMQKKASCGQTDNASSEMWEKYVVQPGDTLGELLQKMKGSEEAFWERNNPQGIYLLPGVAYFIPGSCTSDQ